MGNSFSKPYGESPVKARPFLKWAGGKTQLLSQIQAHLPEALSLQKITRYIEPFVGSGALFFSIAQDFSVEELSICDVNEEIILLYKTIKSEVGELIGELQKMQQEYAPLDVNEQRVYFYKVRHAFNSSKALIDFQEFSQSWIERSAQIIFLNRTCFNGLFRVNTKAAFNVPFGDYKNPRICDENNLLAVAKILARTNIIYGDFTVCEAAIDGNTFIYFDPPYRPISKTANFNAYSKNCFTDQEQMRLAQFCRSLHERGVLWLLSNSDPKNADPEDNFFEELYQGFTIDRVYATRMINSNPTKRHAIYELLIKNYS